MASEPAYVPLRPIPMKDRAGIIFLEYGELDVIDSAFVLVDTTGIRTQIPVGGLACIMLEPGTRVSHAAIVLAARVGCLLVWVGEAGVRLYASGQPGGARRERIWEETKIMIEDGNAVIAWSAPTDSGFAFECIGENRREPTDFDGLTLVKFKPAPSMA